MEYKEIVPDIVEAVSYMPRNYVLTWLNSRTRTGTNNKIAFGPAYELKAEILRSFWPVYAKRIRKWAEYRRKHSGYVIMDKEVPALFSQSEEMLKAKDPAFLFREAVKEKEGTYVTDVEPWEAVRSIERRGSRLNGKVKSKRHKGHYDVLVRGIFPTTEGDLNVDVVNCDCMEHKESMGKGSKYVFMVWDVHPTALMNEIVSLRLNPTHLRKPPKAKTSYKEKETEKEDSFYKLPEFFHPFNFVANWSGERGQLAPKSIYLAMVEMDMAIDYYFNNSTYDQINRQVFRVADIYANALKEAALDGECRFELLKHSSERRDEKDRALADAEKRMITQFYNEIVLLGYEYECNCLEMGRPAIRFENRENVLDFVPGRMQDNRYRPAFYVTKPKPPAGMKAEDMCKLDDSSHNPFKNLNITHDSLDDNTKHVVQSVIRAATTLILPDRPGITEIDIPSDYEQLYRKTIRQYSPEKEKDLKKARLLYDRR